MSLRDEVTRLASTNPELAIHVNPLLAKTANTEIAKTILEQMGGQRRVSMMLGVREFIILPNGITFSWPNKTRSKGNNVEIRLMPDDTYDVEFYNKANFERKSVKKFTDIYAEQLVDVFERQTGWNL